MTNPNQQTWFDVDRTGLAKILRRKGIEFAVFELIQNAWDEAGVSRVAVTLKPASDRGYALITVQDDAPEGFKNLMHAYTLFAESAKKSNVEQRGRFNLGEKLVLSICKWAQITTTKGTVSFTDRGRIVNKSHMREHGTEFSAEIKITRDEIDQVAQEVTKLIPPFNIKTTFNDVAIENREITAIVVSKLPTEIADDEGRLRRTDRKTPIHCYAVNNGETAFIYEMGIPVVEHDCAFHCDVQQKVPLSMDRENVTPEFSRKLHTAVFNETHETLNVEEMNNEWAQTAIESKDVAPEAVEDYMTKRFGELRATFDPSDPEANNKAVSKGYTLVKGGMLSGAAWQNVKEFETIAPAGRLFPTHSDDYVMTEAAAETEQMRSVRAYAQQLAELLLECTITVNFGAQASNELACWSHRTLSFNVTNLGAHWFNLANNRLAIDDLIIHEFGHHYSSNHLSSDYNDALSRLAAKAMALGRAGKLPA
jgi:hypothetical protein